MADGTAPLSMERESMRDESTARRLAFSRARPRGRELRQQFLTQRVALPVSDEAESALTIRQPAVFRGCGLGVFAEVVGDEDPFGFLEADGQPEVADLR